MQMDDYSIVRFAKDRTSEALNLQGFIHNPRWFANLTFFLNRNLHGDRVFGYHLTNLVIHLLTACILYVFIRRIINILQHNFPTTERGESSSFLPAFIPFASAALFVSHPVQTQAVTYIVQRYTSLTTLLYLGSLLAFLIFRDTARHENRGYNQWLCGSIAVVCALLAMKSKEIALTIPVMTMILEFLLFRGKLLKNCVFVFLIVALLLFIPVQMLYSSHSGHQESIFQQFQSVSVETQTISRFDYLLTQTGVVVTYLRLLCLPVNQNLDYDYPIYHSLLSFPVLAALCIHLLLIYSAFWLYKRSEYNLSCGHQGTGIHQRVTCLGIIWFYLALCVESSLIPIQDVIFEHRIYLPSAGFFMAVTAIVSSFMLNRSFARFVACWALVMVCCILTVCTIMRNRTWASEIVMWRDVLDKSPNKARARHALGFLYFKDFKADLALPYLIRAVELEPHMDKYWITLNAEISLLGAFEGRFSTGTNLHSSHDTVDPRFRKQWTAISYNNLGLAYEYSGNLFSAQSAYLKAVAADPATDFAWYNLALTAIKRNDSLTGTMALSRLKALNPAMAGELLRISGK
jgi:hypothetical protein